MEITRYEKNSLLYYQGNNAINNIELTDKEYDLREFYSIKDAYMAINVLLYPGISNEKARIAERKILPIKVLDNLSELLRVYEDVLNVMCRYSSSNQSNQSMDNVIKFSLNQQVIKEADI